MHKPDQSVYHNVELLKTRITESIHTVTCLYLRRTEAKSTGIASTNKAALVHTDKVPIYMPTYILEEDLRPASKEVLLSAAFCKYLHGLKKPARPAGSYCLAQLFNLSATTLAPSRSAHLISPPLHKAPNYVSTGCHLYWLHKLKAVDLAMFL